MAINHHFKVFCWSSILLILTNQPLTCNSEDNQSLNKVCYETFGCFTWTKFVFFVPESPDKIGAIFRVFKPSYHKTGNKTISYHNTTNYDLFDKSKSVVFIIHGWLDKGQEPWYREMFSPLLARYDLLVSVDWGKAGSNLLYPKSVANCQLTGREIGYLLHRLAKERGIDLHKVHLIGFSLGAHIAGLAGRWLKQEYNRTVGRITGLDAAGPLVEGTKIHINKSDAAYVDGIHTSSGNLPGVVIGRLGTKTAFGHKDFYPNGGSDQPHCPFPWVDMKCRHYSSLKFFTSSIDQCEYKATKCDSWDNYTSKKCGDHVTTARMGLKSNIDPGEGSFYLSTGKGYPYC